MRLLLVVLAVALAASSCASESAGDRVRELIASEEVTLHYVDLDLGRLMVLDEPTGTVEPHDSAFGRATARAPTSIASSANYQALWLDEINFMLDERRITNLDGSAVLEISAEWACLSEDPDAPAMATVGRYDESMLDDDDLTGASMTEFRAASDGLVAVIEWSPLVFCPVRSGEARGYRFWAERFDDLTGDGLVTRTVAETPETKLVWEWDSCIVRPHDLDPAQEQLAMGIHCTDPSAPYESGLYLWTLHPTEIGELELIQPLLSMGSATFSPSGRLIAYSRSEAPISRNTPDPKVWVEVLDLETGDTLVIDTPTHAEAWPAWLLDDRNDQT